MFFRRQTPHAFTFAERLEGLRKLGFLTETAGPGRVRVIRNGCAALIEDKPGAQPLVKSTGAFIGDEIAHLVSGGYQMFLRTESGHLHPAQADQLKALHAFEEDLREGLGLVSLYNESLGTTSEEHLYDRVVGRDHAAKPKPWERKKQPAAG